MYSVITLQGALSRDRRSTVLAGSTEFCVYIHGVYIHCIHVVIQTTSVLLQVMTAATAIARLDEYTAAVDDRTSFSPPVFRPRPPALNTTAPEVRRHLAMRAAYHGVDTTPSEAGKSAKPAQTYRATARCSERLPPGKVCMRPSAVLEGEDLEWMPAVVLEGFRPLWCERALLLEPVVRERAHVRALGALDQVEFVLRLGEEADLGPEVNARTVVIDMLPPGASEDMRREARCIHGKPQFRQVALD